MLDKAFWIKVILPFASHTFPYRYLMFGGEREELKRPMFDAGVVSVLRLGTDRGQITFLAQSGIFHSIAHRE